MSAQDSPEPKDTILKDDASSHDNTAPQEAAAVQEDEAPKDKGFSAKNSGRLSVEIQDSALSRRRTIETEFGILVIDDDGIQVMPTTDTDEDHILSLAKSKKSISNQKRSSDHVVGPRMYTMNTKETQSRVLEVVAERQYREDRGVWKSDRELLFVVVSALCGVRCVLELPASWLEHGAGSFQVAYLVFCVLLALPLLLMEAALGQYAAHGLAGLMPQMAPALRGYPYALLISLCINAVCLMADVATVTVYAAESTHAIPPWTSCDQSYNSFRCYTVLLDQKRCASNASKLIYFNKTCMSRHDICKANFTRLNTGEDIPPKFFDGICKKNSPTNHSFFLTWANKQRLSAGEDYFFNVPNTVPRHGSAGAFGSPSMIALTVCWTLVCVLCHYGFNAVRSTLPVTLCLPILILFAFAINLLTLKRPSVGTFFIPDMMQLKPKDYIYAALASLKSMNIGIGINSLIYSRNLLTHDCIRSTVKVALIAMLFTFCFGVGFMLLLSAQAAFLNVEVTQLMESSRGRHPLVAVMSAMSTLNHHRVWSPLLMLSTALLGLGTCQMMIIATEMSLREAKPWIGLSPGKRVTIICLLGFTIHFLFVAYDGYVAILIANHYAACRFGVVMTFVMILSVDVVLGAERLLESITKDMAIKMEHLARTFWLLTWRYSCMALLSILLIGSIVFHEYDPLELVGAETTAIDAAFGIALLVVPLVVIVLTVFYINRHNVKHMDMFEPTSRWRPALLSPDDIAMSLMSMVSTECASSSHILMQPGPSIMTRLYSQMSSAWKMPVNSDMSFALNSKNALVEPKENNGNKKEDLKEEESVLAQQTQSSVASI